MSLPTIKLKGARAEVPFASGGGQGGMCPHTPPVFGRSVNPISTGGTLCPPPRFSDFVTPWHCIHLNHFWQRKTFITNRGVADSGPGKQTQMLPL